MRSPRARNARDSGLLGSVERVDYFHGGTGDLLTPPAYVFVALKQINMHIAIVENTPYVMPRRKEEGEVIKQK